MFDVPHFSITAVALLIIAVLMSGFAVLAVKTVTLAPTQTVMTIATERPVVTSIPDLQVTTASQKHSSVTSLATDQNPYMAFHLLPQNFSVLVNDTFAVTVAVENVTDMYSWQVYLSFDQTVLQCIGVSVPSSSIFNDSMTASSLLKDYNATEFPQSPLRLVRNDEGWVLAGDTLAGTNQTDFNGSGILCQLEFKAALPGSTTLELITDSTHDFQTYIITSSSTTMTSQPSYSNIYVASN
jgi:hypothetical protein